MLLCCWLRCCGVDGGKDGVRIPLSGDCVGVDYVDVDVVAVAGCGAVDGVASGSDSLMTLTLSSVILEQSHQQEKLVIHSS